MSKIKKCLLVIIMSIMCMIILQGKSQAFSLNDLLNGTIGVGGTVTLSKSDMYRGDIYCVQHGVDVKDSMSFMVYQYAKIFLNDVTYYTYGHGWSTTTTDNANGTMAYILNAKGGYRQNGSYTPTQLAIYNWVGKWNAACNFGKNAEVSQTTDSTTLIQNAQSYAARIGDSKASITDKTDKDNISVEVYGENDTEYMRVGPFNWEFKGNLTAISVKSDDKEIPNVRYSRFNGTEEVFMDKSEIKSLENFYITIEASTKYTKITGIDATVSISYSDAVEAEIWRLVNDNPGYQNLILARVSTKPFSDEAKLTASYNIKLTKNLKVLKVDDRDKSIALSGVGFILKNQEMNKYVRIKDGKLSYVESKDKATEFITNKKGKIKVEGLLIGTYEVIETLNPNYGYVLEEQETTIIFPEYNDTMEITNHQKYVKLSGFIWQDINSSKATVRNNLYKTDSSEYQDDKDESFNGITVRLKRGSGETVTKDDGTKQETVSKEMGLYSEINGGEYIFEDIVIDDLSLYYVEFEYDGLIYQSVVLPKAKDLGKENVSKATDVREREILDKNFTSVDATGKNEVNVNDKYTITYNDTVNNATSIKDSSDCVLHARTDDANLNIYEFFKPAMEEIRYINLGLYKKPQADLSLTQDLDNVNVGVNGYWHVYNYGKRSYDASAYDMDDESTWNVGVKFKNSFTGTYKRAIYKSDYDYENKDDASRELQVYLTYKVAITNESSYLTRANSIVDYFDNRFEIIGVGTGLEGENSITGELNYKSVDSNNSNYKKYVIDVNSVVESGKSTYVYIQFKLDRNAVIEIMNGGELLYNRAEITSYTVFKDDGVNTVAAVDRDSVPGNANIDKIETYEDDTDSAPPVQLQIGENARQIAGTVFVDSTTGELKTGEIRQGNGIFDNEENTIKDVKVTLHEKNNSIEDMVTTTDENGEFTFEGYIPGQYTITYTWGDKTYTVQNYKGTIYDSSRNQNDMYWYKDQVDTRKTDAIDNYDLRLEIDKNMSEITDNTIYDEIEKAYNGEDCTIKYTKMDSITPTMEFSVEYDTNVTDGTIDKMEFIVKNVDFGIVERARQQLDMIKRVNSFKITLANGQILIDATVDENGNLQGAHDYLTYMGPENDTFDGFIKAEMDSELIEGATLELGYEIKFVNNSEKDYMSENYYKYGIEEGNLVTLTPSAVVDYLDKDLGFEAEKNAEWGWTQITEDRLNELKAVKVGETDFLNSRTILYTENTATPIEPTKTTSVYLNVSKLLATSNDLTFDNDAETVSIYKPQSPSPRGSIVKFFPEDTSEQAQVTPSTGEDRAYVVPTIVGITSLLILSVGIFIIKKKVIDNK